MAEAAACARQAHTSALAADDVSGVIDASRLLGAALLAGGQLEAARAVLGATWTASWFEGGTGRAVALDLAEYCLATGRADLAEPLLATAADARLTVGERARWWWLRVRTALALGHLEEAGRLASATASACARGPADVRAVAHLAAAWVHAAVGDDQGLQRHVRVGSGLLRYTRAPALSAELELAVLVGAVRTGDRVAIRRSCRSVARHRTRVAPLLRTRLGTACRLAARLTARDPERPRVVPALMEVGVGTRPGGTSVLTDILHVLQLCQEDDGREETVLRRLCEFLREGLEASSVCFYLRGGVRAAQAGQGTWPSAELADRAIVAGRSLPLDEFEHARQAVVPVKWAGEPVAALAARWPLDTILNLSRVATLLPAVAAAAGGMARALAETRSPVAEPPDESGLVGVSAAMARVRASVARAAAVPFSVLIEGESGVGKELIARAVHRLGPRRHRRFCAVNCAALTDDLLESELFGHTRGAFTGAVAPREGLFEAADGGTLFLDEVGELSPRAQAKLLRVLQEGEVRRLGENVSRRVDVRIVAATNRSMAAEVREGRFRDDLRYRLDVVRVTVPPLRERREDIPLLVSRFWADAAVRTGSRARLDDCTLEVLARYHWPGNVRELQNVLAALAVHAPPRGRVTPHHLSDTVRGAAHAQAGLPLRLEEARRQFETDFVRAALQRAGGRRSVAARELGLSRQGLTKLMARLTLGADPCETGRTMTNRPGPVCDPEPADALDEACSS